MRKLYNFPHILRPTPLHHTKKIIAIPWQGSRSVDRL